MSDGPELFYGRRQPTQRRRLGLLVAGLAGLLIGAGGASAWLLQPRTEHQCYEDASRRPTADGVILARDLCFERFRKTSQK